jgi:hypothetical protein
MKTRIEMHFDSYEAEILNKIAKEQGRSRKNLCETEIRKVIKSYQIRQAKKQNKNTYESKKN